MRGALIRPIAVLIVALVLAACGGGSESADGTAGGGPASGAPYTVRFGSVGGLTDAGFYIAEARGYFREQNITVEYHRMGGGSELTTAVASRNLDVAGIAVTAGLFNAVSQGLGLRIVGDKQSARPGASATHLVAQAEFVGADTAETLHNLRGRTVAVTDKASASAALLDFILRKYGMSIADVDLRTLAYPEITTSLINGTLDAAVALEPFLSQALASGHVVDVADQTEVLPASGASTVPLVYSSAFIEQNTDAAQRLMVGYMKGVRDYNDAMFKGIDKEEIVKIIAQGSGQPEEIVANAHPAALDPNQEVSVEFLGRLQDWFQVTGAVQNPIDPAELVDTSFAEYAIAQLGGEYSS